jgi:malonyl CoA-acyl carrier protein transacylase
MLVLEARQPGEQLRHRVVAFVGHSLGELAVALGRLALDRQRVRVKRRHAAAQLRQLPHRAPTRQALEL